MRYLRYLSVALGLILAIALLFLVFLSFRGLDIRTNEIVIVDDSDQVLELIEKNTPIRLEIDDERWGRAVLEEPEVLFEIWNVIKESKSYPSRYIPNQDRIDGYIYFRDGSKEYFSISDRFQLGEYFLESKEEELNIAKLYRILRHTLETKKNLLSMVEKAEEIYLFSAEDFFDPDSEKMFKVTGAAKRELLSYLALAEKVEENADLSALLLEKGIQPLFHLTFSLKDSGNREAEAPIVLSVLSPDYFALMDMGFLNRNVVYFEGFLFDYCCKMLALNLSQEHSTDQLRTYKQSKPLEAMLIPMKASPNPVNRRKKRQQNNDIT